MDYEFQVINCLLYIKLSVINYVQRQFYIK